MAVLVVVVVVIRSTDINLGYWTSNTNSDTSHLISSSTKPKGKTDHVEESISLSSRNTPIHLKHRRDSDDLSRLAKGKKKGSIWSYCTRCRQLKLNYSVKHGRWRYCRNKCDSRMPNTNTRVTEGTFAIRSFLFWKHILILDCEKYIYLFMCYCMFWFSRPVLYQGTQSETDRSWTLNVAVYTVGWAVFSVSDIMFSYLWTHSV